jgi:hypothetical protein
MPPRGAIQERARSILRRVVASQTYRQSAVNSVFFSRTENTLKRRRKDYLQRHLKHYLKPFCEIEFTISSFE